MPNKTLDIFVSGSIGGYTAARIQVNRNARLPAFRFSLPFGNFQRGCRVAIKSAFETREKKKKTKMEKRYEKVYRVSCNQRHEWETITMETLFVQTSFISSKFWLKLAEPELLVCERMVTSMKLFIHDPVLLFSNFSNFSTAR